MAFRKILDKLNIPEKKKAPDSRSSSMTVITPQSPSTEDSFSASMFKTKYFLQNENDFFIHTSALINNTFKDFAIKADPKTGEIEFYSQEKDKLDYRFSLGISEDDGSLIIPQESQKEFDNFQKSYPNQKDLLNETIEIGQAAVEAIRERAKMPIPGVPYIKPCITPKKSMPEGMTESPGPKLRNK